MRLPHATRRSERRDKGTVQGLDFSWASSGRVEWTLEPASWTLRWLDLGALGAQVRTFRGPPPTPGEFTLRAAAASGDDLYVVLAGKVDLELALVGHVTPRSARWTPIPAGSADVQGLQPPGSAGAPLYWAAGGRLWRWSDGQEPRAVAQYDRTAPPDQLHFTVRATDKDSLWVGLDGWSRAIAARPVVSPLPWLPVEGWAHRDPGAQGLQPCKDHGPGVLVAEQNRSSVQFPVGDGSVVKISGGQLRARVNGSAACIEDFHAEESSYSTDGGKTWLNAARGQSRLVVDFARKRGEVALTPAKGKPMARAVSCTLEPPP
jgi:hypothetical protein